MDLALDALNSGAEEVIIQIDDFEEAATMNEALRTNRTATRISLGPRTVPRLQSASVNLILRTLARGGRKWLKMLSLTNCELEGTVVDPQIGSLKMALEVCQGFSYTDTSDTPEVADAHLRRISAVLMQTSPVWIINLQTTASSQAVRLFLNSIREGVESLTLMGIMLDGAILDSFEYFLIRTRKQFIKLDIRQCTLVNDRSIVPKLVGYMRSIRKSNLMQLLIKFPELPLESDAMAVLEQLAVCKSIRVLFIEYPEKYKKLVEYHTSGLPRLIYYNGRLRGNGIRTPATFAVNGSIRFKLEIQPATTQIGMHGPDVPNHRAVYLNNMTQGELDLMANDKKVFYNNATVFIITDSELIPPSEFTRIDKVTHLLLKTCDATVEYISDPVFSKLKSLGVADSDSVVSLSNLKVGADVYYLSFAWCALTSIDLPSSIARQITTLNLQGNMGITEPPFEFVMRYPNITINLDACGFTFKYPYNKIDVDVCEMVRSIYKAKILCFVSRELEMPLDEKVIMNTFIAHSKKK